MAYTKAQAKSIAARGQGGGKRGAIARAKATGNASLVAAVRGATNRKAFIAAVPKPPRKVPPGPKPPPPLPKVPRGGVPTPKVGGPKQMPVPRMPRVRGY